MATETDNLKETDRGNSPNTNINMPHLPAFGGEFQPGLYKPSHRKFGNPAPLGLCGFALTTFVLSIINAQCRDVKTANIVVGLAYGYGGLVQLLAGMWEFAVGNTFGATALSSYGGFWISWAMIETAQGFGIVAAYSSDAELHNAIGFYLVGWFIFTTLCMLCTLRSTVAFFSLFFFLDITFLLLFIAEFRTAEGYDATATKKTAGIFGIITAFIAWWNAAAGMMDNHNSFFTIPVIYFPWSAKPEDKKEE